MSDPTRIEFGPGGIADTGRCRVYTRERWADEWVEEPYLFAEEVTWCCAPAMPAASFRWDYGRILRSDGVSWETVAKLDWTFPRSVKVVAECAYDDATEEWSTRTWHGELEMQIDGTDGAVVDESGDEPRALPTGRQTLTAYGIEALLSRERAQFVAFHDANGEQSCDGLRMTFNHRGTKNRSLLQDLAGDCYIFQSEPAIGEYWSTKEIVRYLLKYAAPRDSDDVREIRFRVRSGCYLPDWDRPEIPLEGQTTLGLLHRLLHRGRLLNWWLEVVTDEDGDIVELVTQTIVEADLPTDLPGNHTIPEASRKLHLIYDTDQETRAACKDSGLPTCDQVVVRGQPVKYVGTFRYWSRETAENVRQFSPGWSSADETKYNQAASTSANYAGLDLVEAQRRNAVARSSPALERVFSRWSLFPSWNGEVSEAGAQLFVRYDGEAAQPIPYSAIEIQAALPIYYGLDYSGDAIADIAGATTEEPQNEREYLPPLVFFYSEETPDFAEAQYLIGQEMGRAADTEIVSETDQPACTVSVHVVPHSRSIDLRVSGKPQHVIAITGFTALPEDEVDAAYEYLRMRATLCLTNGLCVEERYPPERPSGRDAVRIMEIDAGEQYEAVYVAPGTAVGITSAALLARSQGGWIERPYGMRAQLKALAKIAYTWYSAPHFVLHLETTRLQGDDVLRLGDLVVRVGDDTDPNNTHQRDILAPVTEIRLSWPTSDGGQPQAPSMSFTTTAGELDPIQLTPPPPAIEARGTERKALPRAGGNST